MSNNDITILHPCYFSDGSPVPELLTEEEAISFLRLDAEGPKNNASLTMKYYKNKGLLRPTRIGKRNRYSRKELLRVIEIMTNKTDNNPSE